MTRPPILGMQLDRRKVLDIVCVMLKIPTIRVSAQLTSTPPQACFEHNVIRGPTSVEEHVSHGGRLPVHLERVSGEDDPLGNDPGRVGAHKGSHGDQVGA